MFDINMINWKNNQAYKSLHDEKGVVYIENKRNDIIIIIVVIIITINLSTWLL